MSSELEGLVRRARAMFESKFPGVDYGIDCKLTEAYQTIGGRDSSPRTWYSSRIRISPVGNKWLSEFDCDGNFLKTPKNAVEEVLRWMLSLMNQEKEQYARLRDKYFAPFLDADELKIMRDHEQDFLNAFLRGSDVIENVPPELVKKMIENISFVGGLDQIDSAIDTLRQFADAGLTEIALRVHDDPADAIRLIGEKVAPALN